MWRIYLNAIYSKILEVKSCLVDYSGKDTVMTSQSDTSEAEEMRINTEINKTKIDPEVMNNLIDPDWIEQTMSSEINPSQIEHNMSASQIDQPQRNTFSCYKICEPCNISIHENNYISHISGKKHIRNEENYNKKYKTVFVTGTKELSQAKLRKIFKRYGEVSVVVNKRDKDYGFIRFSDKFSVEKALAARVFYDGKRLFVHRIDLNYDPIKSELKVSPNPLGELELPDSDTCPECKNIFECHVHHFISQVELPDDMYQKLEIVKKDLEDLFEPQFPGCNAVLFGSCESTLAFKNSDVDFFLNTGANQPKDFVNEEAKVMSKSKLFKDIIYIPGARIPIVRFNHVKTGLQGDLTVNGRMGIHNTRLIRFMISLHPQIRPMVMVIKYWAKVHKLKSSKTLTFTTYSLVMLVIFYLQQLDPPVLPTVASLQKMVQDKVYHLGWECSFCDEEWLVRSKCLPEIPFRLSLRELLTGFFRFYCNFDYSNVICPLLGKAFPVYIFESEDGKDLPEEMFLYKEKIRSDPFCRLNINKLFKLQDPFELCLNITRNVTDQISRKFIESCEDSLKVCERERDDSLLNCLLELDTTSVVERPRKHSKRKDNFWMKLYFYSEEISPDKFLDFNIEDSYNLIVDSIFLVFRDIFKLNIEQKMPKDLSEMKTQKVLENNQILTNSKCAIHDGLIYTCLGKSDICSSREKIANLLKTANVLLSPFEEELCISHLIYQPSDEHCFTFNLQIPPLEEFMLKKQIFEIIITTENQQTDLFLDLMKLIKFSLKSFLKNTTAFIYKTKNVSKTKRNHSLRELIDLNLRKLSHQVELTELSNITSSKGVESEILEKNSSPSKIKEGKVSMPHNLLAKSVPKDESSISDIRSLTGDTSFLCSSNSQLTKKSELKNQATSFIETFDLKSNKTDINKQVLHATLNMEDSKVCQNTNKDLIKCEHNKTTDTYKCISSLNRYHSLDEKENIIENLNIKNKILEDSKIVKDEEYLETSEQNNVTKYDNVSKFD